MMTTRQDYIRALILCAAILFITVAQANAGSVSLTKSKASAKRTVKRFAGDMTVKWGRASGTVTAGKGHNGWNIRTDKRVILKFTLKKNSKPCNVTIRKSGQGVPKHFKLTSNGHAYVATPGRYVIIMKTHAGKSSWKCRW